MTVSIIGAGLAGSEAAWQVARRGIPVALHEMRPTKLTKAHRTAGCAELVCSNSFRGRSLSNAVGVLKEELKIYDSLVMKAAALTEVPAGGALAVDRVAFSSWIDETIRTHPLISFKTGEITTLPEASANSPVIVATGPLTSPGLSKEIEQFTGTGHLSFFDAISPIISVESIDLGKVFRQSRYNKGTDDYLNIPLNQKQYYQFVDDIIQAEKFGGHEEIESDCIDELRPFEGCMPIEDMIERGRDTLLFGPLKPVGLTDPTTGTRPYAVIQLRQDDSAGNLWSMVGFQTRMRHGEQKRIIRSLPGLESAEFVRLGSVHRNTFIDSPQILQPTLEARNRPGLFFAGQITGVEGYVESTAGGLVAGLNAVALMKNHEPIAFPADTAIGSLMNYISATERTDFQPMNISFGLMASYFEIRKSRGKKVGKKECRILAAEQALRSSKTLQENINAAFGIDNNDVASSIQ